LPLFEDTRTALLLWGSSGTLDRVVPLLVVTTTWYRCPAGTLAVALPFALLRSAQFHVHRP